MCDGNGDKLKALPAALLPWFAAHARDLPWRRDTAPYHVWLSEIMLQQTRVEAVKGYYTRFVREIPDISALAGADPERLKKLWEGLGYYSRVRNLQAAARQIMTEHGGAFPRDYAGIRALKGVGDYTAGAIASICFDLPEPAVDGNVLRVVSRVTGDARCVDEAKTKAAVRDALRKVYPAGQCGAFTQALMELGAVVCLPNGEPDCALCPARAFCAGRTGAWRRLPVKAEKRARRRAELTVLLLRFDGRIAVRKRPEKGLLAGLWELPNVPGHLSPEEAAALAERWGTRPREVLWEAERKHIFTHVEWDMRCFALSCAAAPEEIALWVTEEELLTAVALPTAFRKLLSNKNT